MPAGQLFGVSLRIHFSFALLVLYVFSEPKLVNSPNGIARAVAMVLLIFVAVLLHELGHILALRGKSPKLRGVILFPIGGLWVNEPASFASASPATPRTAEGETNAALAGAFTSFSVALVAGLIIQLQLPQAELLHPPFMSALNLPRSFVWINLFLGALNLLPAYPLDVGRVVRAHFQRTMDPVAATRRAVTIAHGFAIVFIIAGAASTHESWGSWLMLTGLLLFVAGQLEERAVMFHSALETMHIDDVMLTSFVTLSPADTLEDALNKSLHTLQDDFPVIRGNDMVGVITRRKILEALREDGNGYVQSVMERGFEVAHRGETLASAFGKFTQHSGATLLPVIDQERLIGIVTLQNFMHSIGALVESKKLQRDGVE
jgi:Zn-dependent protease